MAVGCRPPYQNSLREFPLCQTNNEIKKSMVEIADIRNRIVLPPCQIMPKVDFDISPEPPKNRKSFIFVIDYLDQVKVISQSQAVNFHSLIGNVGGYIGLFLGNSIGKSLSNY